MSVRVTVWVSRQNSEVDGLLRNVSYLVAAATIAGACGGADKPSVLEIDEGPLVYVAFGTSTVFTPGMTDGVIYVYRDYLADDFGVEVDLRNHTMPGLDARRLVSWLGNSERVLADLADADVVTLHVPKTDWIDPYYESAQGTAPCGGDDGEQCWRDALDVYRARVDELFEALTSVVDPAETLVRVQDEYMFFYSGSSSDRTIISYWQAGEEYVEDVAAGYGIPVAQVFDAFHGPDGVAVPCDEGLLQDDCDHPTAEGARVMANLLRELGYELAD